MRTFIGIDIPEITGLKNLRSDFDNEFDTTGFNWSKESNIHLTLLFLGNTSNQDIEIIRNTLKEVASYNNCFELKIKGLNIFSKRKGKSILWLDSYPSEKMNNLRNDIFNTLQPVLNDIKLQESIFTPHITIARYPKRLEIPPDFINKYENTTWYSNTVKEFALYESRSSPDGIEYHIIDSFSLIQEKPI